MAIIWITGARGFLGRHVAKRFTASGWDVAGLGIGGAADVAIEELPLAKVRGQPAWIEGLISRDALDRLLTLTGRPDAVFHAAGTGAVAPSLADPYNDFSLAVDSTALVLDILRRNAPGAAFAISSSSAVYGCQPAGPIAETTVPDPMSPYGAHKLCAELLCKSMSRNFGLRTAVIRYFSLYGPGLRKQLLWDVVRRLGSAADELTLSGTGKETRDMLHIEDASELAFLAVKGASQEGLVVNGGTGIASTVGEIAGGLAQALELPIRLRFDQNVRSGDPPNLQAAMQVANGLGFAPTWLLADGLRDYSDWWKSASAG